MKKNGDKKEDESKNKNEINIVASVCACFTVATTYSPIDPLHHQCTSCQHTMNSSHLIHFKRPSQTSVPSHVTSEHTLDRTYMLTFQTLDLNKFL